MDKAHEHLNEGLAMAKEMGDSGLSATILNNLGNLFTTQRKYDEALGAYMESIALAKKSGNASLEVRTLTNAAMAATQKAEYKESKTLLDRALEQIRNLDHSHDKAYGLINIGLTYRHLRTRLAEQNDLLLLSTRAFQEAMTVAEAIGDLRALSYASGYLGNTLRR